MGRHGTTQHLINDVHSALNATAVARIFRPRDSETARAMIATAAQHGTPLALMGARHAMGGQQFLTGGTVLDTCRLSGVESFDPERGLVVVLAGTRWPVLLAWLEHQQRCSRRWTVRQKQTGADDFSIGGSVSANVHGRGLRFAPLVDDIEWLDVVDPRGRLLRTSRSDHADLFARVIGGYGLFGLVVRVCLRLAPDTTLQRRVRLLRADRLMAGFEQAIAEGCRYGDFQFAIDPCSDDFLDLGILSCYRPVAGPSDPDPIALGNDGFRHLLTLAHTDKTRAFEEYARFYLASDGQRYPLAAQHSGLYLDGYHEAVDRVCGHRGSEMITELYVPREALPRFLRSAAATLRHHQADVIYGTVRLIERDDISLLPWARERWACVVLNLHVRHDDDGIRSASQAFRALIDRALESGGSFYLTYHRWASPEQIETAYPGFRDFLHWKLDWDPSELFQSDWYRHWRHAFGMGR